MQISEAYREQNAKLHDNPHYGVSGHKWAPMVKQLAGGSTDILDFGCGKRTLEKALGFSIQNYDPCIPGLDATPEPASVVVCGDVLEHIEPECLDDVLDELRRLIREVGLFTIATGPAKKYLPDGRNAHLIQEGAQWWIPKIWQRFRITQFVDKGHELIVIVTPK